MMGLFYALLVQSSVASPLDDRNLSLCRQYARVEAKVASRPVDQADIERCLRESPIKIAYKLSGCDNGQPYQMKIGSDGTRPSDYLCAAPIKLEDCRARGDDLICASNVTHYSHTPPEGGPGELLDPASLPKAH